MTAPKSEPEQLEDPRTWDESTGTVLEITERVKVDHDTFVAICRLPTTIKVHIDGRELPDEERLALLRARKFLP